jgi:hypothetical protein
MKLSGQHIQFHRPDFLKSGWQPLQRLFEQDKDTTERPGAPGYSVGQARQKQNIRAERRSYLGGLVTTSWNKTDLDVARTMHGDLVAKFPQDWPRELGVAELGQLQAGDQSLTPGAAVESPGLLYGRANAGVESRKRAIRDDITKSNLSLTRPKLKTFVKTMDILHGKEGHSRNVTNLTKFLLSNEDVARVLSNTGSPATPADLIEASRWLSLADQHIPAGALAADRPFSKEAAKTLGIDQRSVTSAADYRDLCSIGALRHENAATIASVIEGARAYGLASEQRSIESQCLDLIDRFAAMAAKPFFQRADDQGPDWSKIATEIEASRNGKIGRNGERLAEPFHIDDDLFRAVKQSILSPKQPIPIIPVRDRDLYVRRNTAS